MENQKSLGLRFELDVKVPYPLARSDVVSPSLDPTYLSKLMRASFACTEGWGSYFRAVKMILAGLMATAFVYLAGCADVPDTDDVHDQQLQRSFAAPGQPIRPVEDPDASRRQSVPGE